MGAGTHKHIQLFPQQARPDHTTDGCCPTHTRAPRTLPHQHKLQVLFVLLRPRARCALRFPRFAGLLWSGG